MEFRYLAPHFAVSAQVSPEDMAGLKKAGFAAVICNRPDDEGPGQPAFCDIASRAGEHGIAARHLPVVPGQITAAHGAAFARLLDELPKPVLAFCRTGRRAEDLWTLAQGARRGDAAGDHEG